MRRKMDKVELSRRVTVLLKPATFCVYFSRTVCNASESCDGRNTRNSHRRFSVRVIFDHDNFERARFINLDFVKP